MKKPPQPYSIYVVIICTIALLPINLHAQYSLDFNGEGDYVSPTPMERGSYGE